MTRDPGLIVESTGQRSLGIPLHYEEDRNFEKGGRSFYFFDFDDNVIHLPSKIYLFSKTDGSELPIPTSQYPLVQSEIGKKGTPYEDYEIREDPFQGSFRAFREHPKESLLNKQQPLIEDTLEALRHPFLEWRGPSWNFFVHAVNNARPISIITARGHHPHTIRRAINLLVQARELRFSPNYLSLYPVSYPEIRKALGDVNMSWGTAQLKKEAIKRAVQDAFECFGENPHHRFGMSDDDPTNVELIRSAMKELKKLYPENAFFVFNTHGLQLTREEILLEGNRISFIEKQEDDQKAEQIALF